MDSFGDEESGIEMSSSEDELIHSRNRRNAVHYASIGDFLSSLNISDTALASLQGLKTLSLEHYKSCMQNSEMPPGDMDTSNEDVTPSELPERQDNEVPIEIERVLERKVKRKGKGKGKAKDKEKTAQLQKKHEFLDRGRKVKDGTNNNNKSNDAKPKKLKN